MRAAVLEDPLFGPEDFPDLAGLSEGVRAGYAGAPAEWVETAEAALLECVADGEPFTVQDLRRRGVPDPDDPRRWGCVIAAARRRGWVQLYDHAEQDRANRDRAIVRVWIPGPKAPTTSSEE